jgi:hypothetical protein
VEWLRNQSERTRKEAIMNAVLSEGLYQIGRERKRSRTSVLSEGLNYRGREREPSWTPVLSEGLNQRGRERKPSWTPVLSEGLNQIGRERKRSWTPILSEGLNQFFAGPRFEPPQIYTVDCIRGAIIKTKHSVQLSHCSGVSPINANSRNSWSSFEWTSLPRVRSNEK